MAMSELTRIKKNKNFHSFENPQIIKNNKIQIPKWGWIFRFGVLVLIGLLLFNINSQASDLGDPYIIYSTILPIYSILVLVVAWFLYKNPVSETSKKPLVSVIIPIYNQVNLISEVIKTINNSKYKNLEIIAVNDGSTDGTEEILNELNHNIKNLKIINKKNGGKRKAVGTGFQHSKGDIIILIDSDSILHKNAIGEFVKAFNNDPKVGGVVANVKALNESKNILTKIQDIWYDYQFNIHKTVESFFGVVLCLSGCMAGYRRKAIEDIIGYWINTEKASGDDRELTTLVQSKKWAKSGLLSTYTKNRLQYAANYDDTEDRILSGQSLIEWKTAYISSAVVFTEVPETLKQFYKQQLRWTKGYLRGQFFVSAFFWNKHPLMALIFYLEYMSTLTLPLIFFVVFIYEPFIAQNFQFFGYYLATMSLIGILEGVDSKLRNPKSITWKYKILTNLFIKFFKTFTIPPALLTLRSSHWGTR